MSKTLDEVRKEIDQIDDSVHDLLMKRAALVSSVAAAKRNEGIYGVKAVQPAREARMIRRLLGRHEGVLPRATIVNIWRELVGSVAMLQTGLNVAVLDNENIGTYWDSAKSYFGSVVSMKKISNFQTLLKSIRNDEFSFGVLSWPELNSKNPWWHQLFNQQEEDKLTIVCALPYGHDSHNDDEGLVKSLVVSKIQFMPSGNDISIIGMEIDGDISRDKIKEKAQKAGFSIINLYSSPSPYHKGALICLLEVDTYLEQDCKSLVTLKGLFDGKCLYVSSLGGYPVVPDIYNDVTQAI